MTIEQVLINFYPHEKCYSSLLNHVTFLALFLNYLHDIYFYCKEMGVGQCGGKTEKNVCQFDI